MKRTPSNTTDKKKNILILFGIILAALAGLAVYLEYNNKRGAPPVPVPIVPKPKPSLPKPGLPKPGVPKPGAPKPKPTGGTKTVNFNTNHMVGLYNYSQTCFGNSMTQMLYHSADFRAALEKYLAGPAAGDAKEHRETAQDLQAIFKQLDAATEYSHVTPKQYGGFPPVLRRNEQFDSSEIYTYYNLFDNFDWSAFTVTERTLVTFNNVVGPFDDPENASTNNTFLSLAMENGKTSVSMAKLVEMRYAQQDRELEQREKDQGYTSASTQFVIHALPQNILIQAKRFFTDATGTKFFKNTAEINVDEVLDFKEFLAQEYRDTETRTRYELVSFIAHMGNTVKSGHYYSLFKRSDGTWVRINDTKCEQIPRSEMLQEAKSGYLFMYRRIW